MKNTLILIVLLALFSSCKKDNTIEPNRLNDINEIIETIIINDSLNVLKNVSQSKMFCDSLIKLNIFIPEKPKDNIEHLPPPPPYDDISINNLLYYRIEGKEFFTSKDSLHLITQYFGIKELKLHESISNRLNLTTKKKELSKEKSGKPYDFYNMTIPVFSLDNQKAYVELNHYCGGLCGSGRGIYLKKVNGKWKIIEHWRTWIS